VPARRAVIGPAGPWLDRQVLPDDERLAVMLQLRELDRLGEDLALWIATSPKPRSTIRPCGACSRSLA
jgi:hypothetical protein